jgi:hypothetical protein
LYNIVIVRLLNPSLDYRAPLVAFPKDELVPPEMYLESITNQYTALALMAAGAAEDLGVDLDLETIERWKRIGVCGKLLDDFLDSSPDQTEALALYGQGLAYAQGLAEKPATPAWVDDHLEPMIQLMANAVEPLPQKQQKALFTAARFIGEISLKKTECNNMAEYLELLKAEGKLTAILISESVSEAVHKQPEFLAFATWMGNVVQLGTLLDSCVDLKKDYKNNLTNVKPSVLNMARIAVATTLPASYLFHAHNKAATFASAKVRLGIKPLKTAPNNLDLQ